MKNTILFLLLGFVATGCSVQGEITEIGGSPTQTPDTNVLEKSSLAEVNSGAKGLQLTNSNYKVGYSIGNINGQLQSKTTRGYQVFMTVQGSVFSEEQSQ